MRIAQQAILEAVENLQHGRLERIAEDDLVVAPYLLIAQTDSRHFTQVSDGVYRFLGARVTGEELDGFHGTDESIATAEYARAIKVYYRFLRAAE